MRTEFAWNSERRMISVCITAHQHPRAIEFLDTLLASTLTQRRVSFEIIVSDDSADDAVADYCQQIIWKGFHQIKWIRNPNPGKSSINMNHAIDHAEGEIIKPMFGDDYFVDPYSLSEMVSRLRDAHWGVCTSTHSNDRKDHVPYPHTTIRDLALGNNSYGCPSAMIFKKTDLRFDEELIWLMDCEFYARLYQRYGYPSFISEVKVGIREWDGQVSNTQAHGSVRLREAEYVGNKYRC